MKNDNYNDKTKLPYNLKRLLKPHQIEGYNWLLNVLNTEKGGILADDMGLGKTTQVIAVILNFFNEKLITKENKCLIVLPKSLIKNWQVEFQDCVGGNTEIQNTMNITPYDPNKDLTEAHVILVTYNKAARYYQKIKEMSFYIVILDEAQNIKNPYAVQTQAVNTFKSVTRLAMTGTPLENRLKDIMSIYKFVKGEKLTKWEDMKLILLRRDKSEVICLPKKTIKVINIETSDPQIEEYTKTLSLGLGYKDVFLKYGRKKWLKELINLKRICNHTYLSASSPKIKRVLNFLKILKRKDKVLIFSHSMETIFYLESIINSLLNYPVLTLHGKLSVNKRAENVNTFQKSPAHRIMLISLKAAGVGLNLTAANYIVHFDLWWNPQAENQATDRAYRIGQMRPITVHRYILNDTIEESINILHQKKQSLFDTIMKSLKSDKEDTKLNKMIKDLMEEPPKWYEKLGYKSLSERETLKITKLIEQKRSILKVSN